MAVMPRKCTSRAPWKAVKQRVNSESWIGFQITQPENHLDDDDQDDADIEQLLHGVVMRDVVMREA